MVDLDGKDKGNISLLLKRHSYENEQDENQPTFIYILENRNDKLLEEIETTDGLISTVDAETADQICSLSKQVYAQSNNVEHLKNQIDIMENNRIKDKEFHKDNVEVFNQKFKQKKIELVSQIKVLNAKINTLENFKKMHSALAEKFKTCNERMIENNKNVKDILECISRKFEFDKEMLKSELYYSLLNLTAQFQLDTNKHISLPNQRLMRENIMLENEFLQISKEVSLKKEIETDLQHSAIKHKRNIIVCSSNINKNIITRKVQNSVSKSLQTKFEKMKEHLSVLNVPDPAMEKRYLTSIENVQQEKHKIIFYLSKLQTLLEKERIKIGITKYLQRKTECKIRAVVETLYDLKYIVTCLLKCSTTGSCYVKLLLSLQNKLIKGQSKFQCSIVKSVESILQGTEYRATDLKEPPENIDFKILIESKEETKSKIEKEEKKEISTERSRLKVVQLVKNH